MDTMRKLLLILFCSLVLPVYAQAPVFNSFLPGAQQIGQAEFRRFGFSIYQARLWAAGGKYDAATPFALSLTYSRNIARDKIVQASLDEMSKMDAPVLQNTGWRSELERVLVDVREGETLTAVYQPGQGAVFYYQDKTTGTIDNELARHFFAIWLDPRTSEPSLRQSLLGLSK